MQRARAAEQRGDLRDAQDKRRVSQRKAIRVLEIRAKDGAARNIQVMRYLVHFAKTINVTIAGQQQNQAATGLLLFFNLSNGCLERSPQNKSTSLAAYCNCNFGVSCVNIFSLRSFVLFLSFSCFLLFFLMFFLQFPSQECLPFL